MATKIKPPIYTKEKGYERYKQELLAWKEITDAKPEKQGIFVALSLPENDESGIRERVFDEMTLDDLKKSLLKFKGEQGGGGEASAVSSIKLEPVFLANQEEALWNTGYVPRNAGRRYRGYRGRPWQNFQRRRGNYQCGRNENYGNGNPKEP